MKTSLVTATLHALILLAPNAIGATAINFDDIETNRLPPGWTASATGKGESKWTVEKDGAAPSQPNVLKQSASVPSSSYPVCFKENTSIKDGWVEVKFKPVSGETDQAGGVLWRCKDANNYYVCRANVLEDNIRVYRVVSGKRTQFKTADLKVAPGQWHTLRVEFSGPRFAVFFNGAKLYDAEDNTLAEAGKVGLWTKADSVTLFDDFGYGSK